jgi:hypothetical protein
MSKTGGPAFPSGDYHPKDGMTLRDWFAGQAGGECFKQAMKRGFEGPQHIDQYTERAASWAYRIADAMIAERSK